MIKINNQKTTIVDSSSDEFKIIVKKMILWQRENDFFKGDNEREVEEFIWRQNNFFYGHKTDFSFSNGMEKSLIVLNFLIPLAPYEEGTDETGGHYEHLNLIAEVIDGSYELVPNTESVICIHTGTH